MPGDASTEYSFHRLAISSAPKTRVMCFCTTCHRAPSTGVNLTGRMRCPHGRSPGCSVSHQSSTIGLSANNRHVCGVSHPHRPQSKDNAGQHLAPLCVMLDRYEALHAHQHPLRAGPGAPLQAPHFCTAPARRPSYEAMAEAAFVRGICPALILIHTPICLTLSSPLHRSRLVMRPIASTGMCKQLIRS